MKLRPCFLVCTAMALLLGACSSEPPSAAVETPREGEPADMDDPAVWVHPTNRAKSLIVAAAKKGGLRVYDLSGRLVKSYPSAVGAEGEPINRYNNVDVQYDFDMGGGVRIDVAVASDRLQDSLRIWKIDPQAAGGPLVDITDPSLARLFPTRPDPADREHQTVDNPNNGKNTAYGLTLYRDKGRDELHALVNQNNEAVIAQFELTAVPGGRIGATFVRRWLFPYIYEDQDLTQENEADPTKDFSPQFEGMAVDQQTGILYAGQEDVGIWRIDLQTGAAETRPFYETTAFDPQSTIARDVEGLSIYYASGGEGYLIASSQGRAHGEPPRAPQPGLDDTFAVFAREGKNAYLGSFSIGANPARGIDAVQECDGAEVSNVALPGFPFGVLIVQDGYDDDLDGLSGEPKATNLKLVPWQHIAGPNELAIDTGYDPRAQR
ncbi:phytase [Pendulispora albinea]|uniref:Phytase n=1 Tax=Pendulispora albinea TaxID=2741071 RepID=A0ABZ2LM51_9BACT